MRPLLQFTAVAKGYGGKAVLHPTNLRLLPGEILAITGPSGAGKSTLLRLAAGLLPPDSGQVTVHALRCGFVFQEPRLLPWLSALDNAALPLRAQGHARASARHAAAQALDSLGLAGFHAAYPAQLSGGMRQRVNMARALALRPDLLLMDEPYTGLDEPLKDAVRAVVDAFLAQSGAAALLVTHDRRDFPAATTRELRLGPA